MPVKFRELQKELGMSAVDLHDFRKEVMGEEGFYREKNGGAWFTDSGAEKLRLAHEAPLAVPKQYKAFVVRRAPNIRWVYAKAPDAEMGVVPVLCGTKLAQRVIGKTITVDIIRDALGGVTYRHADLGFN